jgi:Fic family protein
MDRTSVEPLGTHRKLFWEARPGAEGGRKARQAGTYEAFIPAEIAGRRFALDDDVVAQIASATKALAHLNAISPARTSLKALADALMRSESAASSWIEGIAVSQKRLAHAAFRASSGSGRDTKAAEILGNVEAMKRAIELGADRERISVDDIREIHRILLRYTADRSIAGVIRERQNWIGTNPYTPVGADYVPPPPEYVLPLLEDLCRFLDRDDLAPIAQAAIAHAQFENIHPFADGNGRIGRTLIHIVLGRGGEAENYIPPISLVLAATQKSYVAGFGEFSGGNVSSWCDLFAAATKRSAVEAERMAAQIDALQAAWLEQLGNPRSDAAVHQLIAQLPAQPVVDISTGQGLTGKSREAVRNALAQLERASIMRPLNERKWGRVWECRELLELIEDFEESARRPPST